MSEATSAAEKPKVRKSRLHLTPDEAQRLVAAAAKRGRHPFRDKVLLRLIYRHGLRASEARDPRWDDINLDAGTIHVRRKKMGKDSTHSMDRDELGGLRKLFKDLSGPFVFTTERGGPLSVDTIQYIVGAAGEACGLPDAHPHMLRHSAGYCLVNQGQDMRLIQDFLGHKTPMMTQHYTAMSPRRLAALRVR